MPKSKNSLQSSFARNLPTEIKLDLERKLARQDHAIQDLRREIKSQLKEIEKLELDKSVLLGMDDRNNVKAWNSAKAISTGDAAVMLLLSDLHIEEVIKPETVNGLNEYNPAIAEQRLQEVVRRFIFMVQNQYRATSKISECVLWLGGDIITGQIHDELVEVGAMSPIKACIVAEKLLDSVVKTLLQHGDFDKITVVASSGNHDRDTHKIRVATRTDHSYSTLIYQFLRQRYEKEKRVAWNIAQGQFVYLDVLGKNIRFTHGDGGVKYQGGLAGLSAPLNRAVFRWNAAIYADFTIAGHFHSFEWNRPNNWLINGSLIGTSPYGLQFSHQEPCQSAVVITRRHGVVSAVPIFTG